MKKVAALSLALLVCFFSLIFAQEKIEDIVKSAPSRGKYPDSSAVVVRAAQTFTLDKNGNKTEEYFRVLEVFTLTGREKFSDFRIPFDKNDEKVEVLLAKTFKPDSSSVDVEQKAINDVTPPALAEAEMYANILHRVLSFPSVDPGNVLAIRYKKDKEKAENIDGLVLFQFDEPIVRKELKIIIPQEKSLRYRIKSLKADFAEEGVGGEKIYSLLATDSPQIKPEEFMPPLDELASRVIFSTFKDWEEACLQFSDSFFEAVNPSEEIKKITEEIVKGASSQDDKIKKIFFFVAKEIRNVRFKFGEGGYDVHHAETVLKNRYGDWKDKSALLVTMLKAAGVAAYPVLINSRSIAPEEDVPTLKQFDAILVAVPGDRKEDYLFLNPFADDSLFGYFFEGKDAKGLMVKPGVVEFTPVRCLPEAESVLRNDVSVEIDEKGDIQGKISSELSGFFDKIGRQQLKDKTAKELDVFYSESINKICEDAKALKNQLTDPKDLAQKIKIAQEFSGRNFGIFQGKIMLITIPQIPYVFSDLPSVPSLAKRQYPFRLSGESEIISTVTLKIPADFKPLYLPEAYSFQKDCGDFSFSTAFDKAQSLVVIKKTLVFKKRDIPVDQYDEFKKIMDSFGITKNTLILLEKK
jgi:hypothetical protein